MYNGTQKKNTKIDYKLQKYTWNFIKNLMLFTAIHFEINLQHKPKAAAAHRWTYKCMDRRTVRGTTVEMEVGSVYVVLENQLAELDCTQNFD